MLILLVLLREFAIFFRFVSLETRLKAEAEAATAAGGLEVVLDLKEKMGMVVNPGESSLSLSLSSYPILRITTWVLALFPLFSVCMYLLYSNK